jgi:ankyrin repeat protein
MNSEDARGKLESLGVGYSEDNFFNYVQKGDREMVELFLDAGIPVDSRNLDRDPAILVASQSGKIDIVRLLLARGASPEPLIGGQPKTKDVWDKLTATSGLLSFSSGILIAAVGGYFTYSYNQRQIDLNKTQSDRDVATKEESNKVLELDAIQKLIPSLTSKNEREQAAALAAIQDLAHPELAAHLAVLFRGPGSVQYLKQAASSSNPNSKQVAIQALSTLAADRSTVDSHLAEQALSTIFESSRHSVVRLEVSQTSPLSGAVRELGAGVILSPNGLIVTCAHLVTRSESGDTSLQVTLLNGKKLNAKLINSDESRDLAILGVDGDGFSFLNLAANRVQIGSKLIGIEYLEHSDQSVFSGNVSSIVGDVVFSDVSASPGASGSPLLDSKGEVVALINGRDSGLKMTRAIPSDVILSYLERNGLRFVRESELPH